MGLKTYHKAAVFLFSLLSLSAIRLEAKPGDLDVSFGTSGDGMAKITFQPQGNNWHTYSILSLPNGEIVLGGFIGNYYKIFFEGASYKMLFSLLKFDQNGKWITSFGNNGIVSTDFGEGDSAIQAMALTPGGSLIGGGSAKAIAEVKTLTEEEKQETGKEYDVNIIGHQAGIAEYDPTSGTLAPLFGTGGIMTLPFPDEKYVYFGDLIAQSDNKILVGGNVSGSTEVSAPIIRLNPNGTMDQSFGTQATGIVSNVFGKYYCGLSGKDEPVYVPAGISALASQPDGKIVAVGSFYDPKVGYYRSFMVRYLKNGVLDPNFGQKGNVLIDVDSKFKGPSAIAITENGRIVFGFGLGVPPSGGNYGKPSNVGTLLLMAFQGNGSLDKNFGPDGTGTIQIPSQGNTPDRISIQSDGKIVISSLYDLVRLTSGGQLDPTFGSNGKVMLWDSKLDQGFGKNNYLFQATDHALQPDGRIVVAGSGHYVDEELGGCYDISKLEEEGKPKQCEKIVTDAPIIKRYLGFDCETNPPTWYKDADADGYGDKSNKLAPGNPNYQCPAPQGYVINNLDCNDTNKAIHPGAEEKCSDNIDSNCNGNADEGEKTWYNDQDGDGYGWAGSGGSTACGQPPGSVDNDLDCDDQNPQVNTTTNYYPDADNDGYGVSEGKIYGCMEPPPGYAALEYDCAPQDPAINPGATEVCNDLDDDCDGTTDNGMEVCDGLDNDCDGLVDDADDSLSAASKKTYYLDEDGDGFGTTPKTACNPAANYATVGGDCDDTKVSVNPIASETCNGVDDNCQGGIDEGITTNSPETVCDNKDDNCNGETDEGLTIDYSVDADKDQYIAIVSPALHLCPGVEPPPQYVPSETLKEGFDCNDQDPNINPGAPDNDCNNIDDDCNNGPDNKYVTSACDTGKPGVCAAGKLFCMAGAKNCIQNFEPSPETCNNADDDCDGQTDEADALGIPKFYPDKDKDTFGDQKSPAILSCTDPSTPQLKYVQGDNTDCDDDNGAINTDGVEICNDKDDNCNSNVDEGVPTLTFYIDTDGDGYGSSTGTVDKCSQPEGYAASQGDCDDGKKEIHPNAPEVCNGIDDNCNSETDEGKVDGNACESKEIGECKPGTDVCKNGVLECISNKAPFGEVCNGADDDCDGKVDDADESVTGQTTFYLDKDGDTFGDVNQPKKSCSQPAGYTVGDFFDCDDNNAEINMDAAETCNNGIDDNCNGAIDGTKPDGTKDPSDGC